MSKDNLNQQLDFRNIDSKDTISCPFPTEVYNEFRIFFATEAYDEMKRHANLTSEVELGGVLIGDVCHDKQGNFLKICGIIPGEHANNYGAQVTFTHETWQHINEVKDKKYPDKRIVGWYHTHPGFGVFLSDMDKFIQDNFFNLPYQIAVVIETKEMLEGCFIWREGNSIPIQRYWVEKKEIALSCGKVQAFDVKSFSSAKHEESGQDPNKPFLFSSPIRTLFFSLILLVFGFVMGQLQMIGELKKSLYEMLQSEVYSIMEFASLNTAASQDFDIIREQLQVLKKQAGDVDKVCQGIDKLSATIKNLQTTYDKHRTRFRKDLIEMQEYKDNLSQKVNKNRLASEELKSQIALLAIIRIKDTLDKTAGEYDKLSDEDKYFVSSVLTMALYNDPSSKILIEKVFPGLIKKIMPEIQERKTINIYNQIPSGIK